MSTTVAKMLHIERLPLSIKTLVETNSFFCIKISYKCSNDVNKLPAMSKAIRYSTEKNIISIIYYLN